VTSASMPKPRDLMFSDRYSASGMSLKQVSRSPM